MDKISEQSETKKEASFAFERAYYGVLVLILAGVALFGAISSLGALPRFCGLCHEPSYNAWQHSSHSFVTCNACHSGSNVFEVVSGRVRLARMVPAYFTTFYRRPVTATVSRDKCMVCHEYIKTQTTQSETLRVSHKEIIEANYDCSDCHSTTAHGKAAVRQNFAELGKCLKCHNDTGASAACETCHVKEGTDFNHLARVSETWRITHGKNWRKTHGMGDLNACQACHSKSFCSGCHQISLPHPGAWLTTHGKAVVASNLEVSSCRQCHKDSLCENCHRIQMPHPKEFLSRHSKIVKNNGATLCYNCHLKEGCTRCHGYHIHPGLPQDKLKLLRKEAGFDK